jgi:hypothetical protein
VKPSGMTCRSENVLSQPAGNWAGEKRAGQIGHRSCVQAKEGSRRTTSNEIWPPIEYVRPRWPNLALRASTNFARRPWSLSKASNSCRSEIEALRPIGETLIMPLRNSTNVPLSTSIGGKEGLVGQIWRRVGRGDGRGRNGPLDGDVHVGNVVEDEVDERLVLLLADKLDERLGRERLAELVRRQAVLGKAEVKAADDWRPKARSA